jgi:hypothetical protein
MRQLADGQINAEQAAELIKVMGQPNEGVDVTLGFRVALVSQGYEREALKLGQVRMHLVEAGAMFNYSVAVTDDDWLDARHEELDPVFLRASIMVLRSGNIDAVLDPDTPNQMAILGEIVPGDIEQLVGMFREEIDEQFPDKPKPRTGEWW